MSDILRAGTPTDSSLDLSKCLLRMVPYTKEAVGLYVMKEFTDSCLVLNHEDF